MSHISDSDALKSIEGCGDKNDEEDDGVGNTTAGADFGGGDSTSPTITVDDDPSEYVAVDGVFLLRGSVNERFSANKSDADAPIRLIVSASRCDAVVSFALDSSAEASATNNDNGSTMDIFFRRAFLVVW